MSRVTVISSNGRLSQDGYKRPKKTITETIQNEEDIQERLKDYREITQQELANAVGVTRVPIHSVETGKFVPSTLLALKLARFFDGGVDDLFYLADADTTD